MQIIRRVSVVSLATASAVVLAQLWVPAALAAASAAPTPAAAVAPTREPAARVNADGEVPSMRSAQSRTFRGGGVDARGKKLSGIGYSTRGYSAPVNYQDGAGVWQKIDTTMRATTPVELRGASSTNGD